MAYQIVYTKNARQSIASPLDYLELQWFEKVANEFVVKLTLHIDMLAGGTLE